MYISRLDWGTVYKLGFFIYIPVIAWLEFMHKLMLSHWAGEMWGFNFAFYTFVQKYHPGWGTEL